MPRKNKRRRNNHNNNRKKVKQLNNDGCGVTIGGQPTNVAFVGGTEQSIELAARQTEMGSDNSKIDCIVVVPDGDDSSVGESENKNELSENGNENKIDDPNVSNEMDGIGEANGKCVDQNNVINQSNEDSDTIMCPNIVVSTGVTDANESCNDSAYNKQNTSSLAGTCGDLNSIQEPKSTNKSKIPKAVIANCFTYDSCTEETPPPHVTSDVDDHENAQIKFNEKCFGSIPNDTNISEDKTNRDFDKKVEPLVRSDKVAFNPIMQEIANNSSYRVDSPSAMTTAERPRLVGVKKSRSMDDNDVMIQEMSDTGSIGDNENTPIVSEAESEVESDIFDISPSPSGVLVSVQTIPFSGPLVDLSAEEEELIQNLINDPKSDAMSDKKIQKIKKRSALENHFLPQFLNPKYLDVIKEEASDTSDVESKNAAPVPDNREPSFDEELDDDVFLDNNSIVQKTNAVFPKINLNFTGRRKHVSHLKSPTADVIREEPQCFLVDTKLVDPDAVEESCSKWTTSVVSEQPVAELVYIGSSSSSASDANDQESVGEADGEESCDEDSDVRIKTPIIGCDDKEYSLIVDSGFKSLNPACEAESFVTNAENAETELSNEECAPSEASESHESAITDIGDKNSEEINDSVIKQIETDDQIPQFIIGAPCSNNMFPIVNTVHPSAVNELQKNEFLRQDSSGSICSSLSHSTSQSQSTARFCATSPPRDLADFENSQCVSGASSLTQQIKTLRQIAVEKLMSMPYGSIILEELAIVAESLSNLTDHQPSFDSPPIPPRPESFPDDSPPPIPPKPNSFVNESSPPIPPKPVSFYENSPPPVPPKPPQNRFETQPPPIPPKPTNTPYSEAPFIDPETSKTTREIKIVQLPATSVNTVPISHMMINSGLGVPIEQNPSVSPCLSPSQRNYIEDNTHSNEIKPDLLLEMHSTFVNRRGYHEYTDIELKEPHREQQHLMNDDRHNETVAKNDDNNRLLAIIRDSKQSTGENSAAHNVNVECDRTFERNNQSGDKISSIPSADGNLKMSNEKQIPFDNSTTAMTQPSSSVRTYSNVEKSTYETRKRIENGNVVFEFSNSTKETSTDNNGNKECTKESKESSTGGDLTDSAMMKSDINLEENSVSSTSNHKIPSSPINSGAGNMENAKNEKSTNQQQRNVKAKSEYFDDKISFKEFDYVPKFFGDDDFNQFFNSNHERSYEERKREENHYQSSEVSSSRPQSSLQEWLKDIDEANSLLDNIVKPIVREENLCKGMGSKVNVRAPRLHTVEVSNEVNDKFDEAQRRYEMYVTKQNHMYNRQSMIDKTPITPHVSTRRKSLPKELQQKQLEYIRKKEQELNFEFDKLEHDRMRLLQEIEEMKVNQHVKDFVTAHKLNYSSNNFISRHQSEAELLRQQMHDEWLNKVAEREERRLQKIIKITKPGEENAAPEHGTRKATVEHEFLNRVKERRTKLKMPSDSDWESGAESQPTERDRKEEKVDPKIKVIESERETNLNEFPKHIKEFASDFTTTTERTDTSVKETTESSSSYEIRSSSVATNDDAQPKKTPNKNQLTSALKNPSSILRKKPTNIKKQTKFQLAQHRRSLSDGDLLHEIDNALVLSKGFLFARGIWSPGTKTEPHPTFNRQNSTQSQPPTPPPPPFWAPKSAEPSPTFDRKEFRPVKFESPQLSRKVYTKEEPPVQSPWSYSLPDKIPPPRNPPISTNFNYTPPCPSNIPKSQTSTITLLQKAKENQLPRSGTTNYMQTERKQITQNYSPGIIRPNEVVYAMKNEYLSEQESENERPKKMVDLGHKKIEGIGPTTKQGMPIVLRSEVDENNHHKWYKKMYNTLHKVNQNDDTITVRYKTRRGRYPYKTSGYLSEPEPNYDSDYSIYKYSTLDRRRNPPLNDSHNNNNNNTAATTTTADEKFYGTMPNPIKCGSGVYRNQPGRIENYVPGHSSVSDKERKEWWDQVLAIFDGRTEHEKLASRSYTEGYLSRALKDQGYESDSTLVFRKRDTGIPSPLSPVEQKQAYLNLQAGGEAPPQGFRKQAPEKPKDDHHIEYFPITSTLTKIRVNNIDSMIKPHKEIICYPITNITRPIDLFGPFPKSVQTFVPVNPPAPPNRKSSKRNTTLQIFSDIQSMAKQNSKKPTSSGPINTGTITLRKSRLAGNSNRSRSTGSVVSTFSLKEEKNVANDFRSTRRQFCRVSSVSPIPQVSKADARRSGASPIAFGRSISKERTFAEEKKKLEQRLPLCRKSFTASTSILRNPDLKSPDQIKKAVQTTFRMPVSTEKYTASKSTRKVSAGGTVKTSDYSFSSNKSHKGSAKNDEKSLRLTVAISSKSKEPLKTEARIGARSQTSMVKSNITRGSRSCESKFTSKSKNSSKSVSNLSLARTSSTYSIDSCNSKKRSYHGKSLNVIKSTSKETVFPLTISGKGRKKKANAKEKNTNEGTDEIDNRTVEMVSYNSTMREDEKSLDEHYHDNIDEAIRFNRTDTFFQNLFLRDVPSPPPSIVSCVSKNTSVQEKARLWDTVTRKADTKSKHQSVYLTNKRAVSGSKFKTMEHDRIRQSRSLSPQKLFRPKCLFYDSVTKYDSFHQLSDEEEDFGSMTHSRTTELVHKFEEPTSNVFLTEVIRPNSPVVIHGRQSFEYMARNVSPVRDIRSPSCRRIQQRRTESFKANNQKTDQKKVVRARSLGSSDRYHSLDSHALTRSNSMLNANSYENHVPMCSHQKSERFKELNRFYNNLERVGQLERATSSTDLRPIRKEGDLIDFDEWKQVRDHEKAEKELNHLVDKLRRDEKEKDFLFRPKYVEDMKWNERRDSGLRIKEKSVEDLKDMFKERHSEERQDELKKEESNASKGTYKPLWRGSSVLDLASNMVVKYNPPVKTSSSKIQADDTRIGISKKLISTLTRDQIAKIKNQLSEIYNNNFSGPSQCEKNVGAGPVPDKFVINVSSTDQPKNRSLVVRSTSLVRKEELLGPILKRHQERLTENLRSESISSIHEPRASRSVERYEDLVKREQKEISEAEKKSIFFSISKEIQDKLHERRQKSMAPIFLAKETRGAIASDIARNTLSQPQKGGNFLDQSETVRKTSADPKADGSAQERTERTFHEAKNELDESKQLIDIESNTEQLPKNTERILEKIHYFEKKKDEAPETTIYHAREYSSPDEEEIMRIIEEKMAKKKAEQSLVQGRSSSVSDFKELFGERDPGPARTRTPSPAKGKCSASTVKAVSNSTSVESVFRSRSVSPYYEQKNYKTYYNIVRTGDVQKMKDKFESLTFKPRRNFIEIPPRRFQSDPDLNKIKRITSPDKITVKTHEAGDVSWITHKFEVKNSAARGRSRVRRVISPIPKVPFKKEDRFMPHIDIISKTASLKQEMKKSPTSSQVTNLWTGEVQKMRSKFESPDRLSLMGQMYTSSPDISELKDISNYLTGPWIAHKYPNARDNARSPVSPDKGPISTICKKRVSSRPCSTSPPRSKSGIASILKPFYDMFANQDYDPMKHRPINRYVPDKRIDAELLWRRLQKNNNGAKPTVKFEDTEVVPPPPPIKGVPLNLDNRDQESPHRYVESDVNIHYKTPVRFEYKDPMSESELAYRQAEQMKKLYQEERRRKYLLEMQDMSNRRHTDNFTPSQKSPIALNRYDDFGPDASPKSPLLPRTVARALYNFQGQTARELSFKKGDIIYIRREIDKNWYEGEHNAAVGLLPSNYIEIITRDGIRITQKKLPEGQARAKFNFHAQSAIELSLNKGELVALTRRVDDNWFEGRIANRKGIFPVSYVDVLTDIGADSTPIISSKPIGSPAAHSLTLAPSPDYSVIRPNFVSDLSAGIVPQSNGYQSNGVVRETKTIQKTEVLHVDTNSEPVAYRAIYKYRPQNSDELELQEGDIVYVLEKCDDGWFVGTSQRTGYFGTFPGNYVERN
ncbi:uncharacterized protein LOC119083642 isoform X2 [Bradysia coprophila]|uniref:uncharacterized protein LOC119083642 isoform X2 n=1 Tax=Bradysia coprophila TaxID=38358 RepID=UPI00187DD7D9|nr:uncharacterized protein LOC119083642 isoform X2 [Bradysia coprophila]